MKSATTDRDLVAATWQKLWPGTDDDEGRIFAALLQRQGGMGLRKQAEAGDVVAALTLLRYQDLCLSLHISFEPLPVDVRPDVKVLAVKDCLAFFGDDVVDRRKLKSLAVGWMQTAAESRFDLAVMAYFRLISEMKDANEGFIPANGGPTLADHATLALFFLRSAADEGSYSAAYALMNAYNVGNIVAKNAELASHYAKIAVGNPDIAKIPSVRKLAKLDL